MDRSDLISEPSNLTTPSPLPQAVEREDIKAEVADMDFKSKNYRRAAKQIGKVK